MPNPKKRIDCSVVSETYGVLQSCPPLQFARKIAGEKYTSPEHMLKFVNGLEKTHSKFDFSGKNGEYIIYPGSSSSYTLQKHLANTPAQEKLFKEHSKILIDELDEISASEELKNYPAIKSFVDYRNKFLKAAAEGTDRWAVMAEMPGGYSLKASADWTQEKKATKRTLSSLKKCSSV